MVTVRNPDFGRSYAFNLSLVLVEALGKAGLTVVSTQPTPAMVEAGARAGNVGAAEACRIYTAMIGADI